MNITHLRYAVEVARTGSISQAAENLAVGQPNLSKALKELEGSLGTTLFNRTSKGAIPTPQGQAFLQYARSLLSQLDEMENLFAPGQEEKPLCVAATPSAVLTQAVAETAARLPEGQTLCVAEYESAGVVQAVAEGRAGLGLVRCAEAEADYLSRRCAEAGLAAVPLRRTRAVAVMSENHPLANSRPLLYPDLAGYIRLSGPDSAPALSVSRVRRSARLPAAPGVWELSSPEMRLAVLASRPDTYAFEEPLPRSLQKSYGLAVRACVGAEQEWLDLRILPEEQALPPAGERLLETLEALWRDADAQDID